MYDPVRFALPAMFHELNACRSQRLSETQTAYPMVRLFDLCFLFTLLPRVNPGFTLSFAAISWYIFFLAPLHMPRAKRKSLTATLGDTDSLPNGMFIRSL